jgi:hypothetical protein
MIFAQKNLILTAAILLSGSKSDTEVTSGVKSLSIWVF